MNKYFVVYDKNMACAIRLLTKETFYTFDSYDGGKHYSFRKTEEVIKAYNRLGDLLKEFK